MQTKRIDRDVDIGRRTSPCATVQHAFILQINSGLHRLLGLLWLLWTGSIYSGDTARLNQFADRGYLKELERRASTVGRTQRGAVTEWQFHKFVRPPTCLSIRAHDFYSEFRKSLVIGDRLYVNMIVKFESIQVRAVTSEARFPILEVILNTSAVSQGHKEGR